MSNRKNQRESGVNVQSVESLTTEDVVELAEIMDPREAQEAMELAEGQRSSSGPVERVRVQAPQNPSPSPSKTSATRPEPEAPRPTGPRPKAPTSGESPIAAPDRPQGPLAQARVDPPELKAIESHTFDADTFSVPSEDIYSPAEAQQQDHHIDIVLRSPDSVILFWGRATANWQGWPHPGYMPHRAKLAIAYRAIEIARSPAVREAFRRISIVSKRTGPSRTANSVILYALGQAIVEAGSVVQFRDPPPIKPRQLEPLEIDRILRGVLHGMGFNRDDVKITTRGADGSMFAKMANPTRPSEAIYRAKMELNVGREFPMIEEFVMPADPKMLTTKNVERAMELFAQQVHRKQYPIQVEETTGAMVGEH